MTAMKTMTCRWRLARLPPDLCTGSATAEFAIVLPSIIAIAGLILAIGRVVIVSMDCQSAAAAAAREFVVTGDIPRKASPGGRSSDWRDTDVSDNSNRHYNEVWSLSC